MARLITLSCLLALACGKGGSDSGAAGVVSAWQRAGLEPSAFEPADGKGFGDAHCRAGKVKGIDATVCEFADAGAAKRAEAAGLAQVQNATGLALSEGKLLLVLVDRGHSDPSGKRMNEIAKTFRNR